MKLNQSLKLISLMAPLLLASLDLHANENAPPLVEVELQQDNLASYKTRREDHGAYVGIKYEGLDLKNFTSNLDAKNYRQLFGSEPIPLLSFEADYKYNFFLGSIALGMDFGKGSLSDSKSGEVRSLDVLKYGASIRYSMDIIIDEPYVVPYFGVGIWQMTLDESSPTTSFSETTEFGMNYRAGLLLQLDWIDFDTSKNSTFQWGLENTFIDIYATQYAKTSSQTDPNTETDVLFGGGLRLEF